MADVKLRAGKIMFPAKIYTVGEGKNFEASFGYNQALLTEIKNMEGAKWHGYDEQNPRKVWTFLNNRRNRFQLNYLMGNNPYARWDVDIENIELEHPYRKNVRGQTVNFYAHQSMMIKHILYHRWVIIAAEMGLGKTLAAFEALERIGYEDIWWVAPKNGIPSYQLEAYKWMFRMSPITMTYDGLVKKVSTWTKDSIVPQAVIFDESQRIRNPTAKRSQAAFYLAETMRDTYGDDCVIVEMTGTPSPKSPVDWWFQAEIACPGYLKEGNYHKFKQNLGLIVQKDSAVTGGTYPELVTWWNDENLCKNCGKTREEGDHTFNDLLDGAPCKFEPSVNEVARLYKRLKGLVVVQLKQDCLDLPEKNYRIIRVEPSASTLRAAQLIKAAAPRAITALTLLRELSDGFQYVDIPTDEELCPVCQGNKAILAPKSEDDGSLVPTACPSCNGQGTILKKVREATHVPCPKEEVFLDILDDLDDVGRCVAYAGFTASIDRLCNTVRKHDWHYIRADGRGWDCSFAHKLKSVEMLIDFQKEKKSYVDKCVFIGHPGSAGVSLTLTASPVIVYYSNDFHGEHRMQSEDRIHRPGMDVNRGATIIDIFHLPSDEVVYNNIKKKKGLQDMSMGVFRDEMQKVEESYERVT